MKLKQKVVPIRRLPRKLPISAELHIYTRNTHEFYSRRYKNVQSAVLGSIKWLMDLKHHGAQVSISDALSGQYIGCVRAAPNGGIIKTTISCSLT